MTFLPEVFHMAIKEQFIKASFTFSKSLVIPPIYVRLKKLLEPQIDYTKSMSRFYSITSTYDTKFFIFSDGCWNIYTGSIVL